MMKGQLNIMHILKVMENGAHVHIHNINYVQSKNETFANKLQTKYLQMVRFATNRPIKCLKTNELKCNQVQS